YPTYFAGFVLGPTYGFAVGLLTPLISHLVTGMPAMQPPVLPYMAIEMAAYGLVIGFVSRKINNIFIPLLTAMVVGRIIMLAALYLLIPFFKLPVPPLVYFKTGLVTSIPGIVIQLILVPTFIAILKRRTSLNERRFTESD
ncbi:MAG TPA: ECF transporter S component, partial [Clostridia bacterium]|nr:ECF transporter S component [Clostridia bacterium]